MLTKTEDLFAKRDPILPGNLDLISLILMDWLNARIITSADPFRMKTTENFAAFGSKHRKFFEVNFSDVLIRNGYEVVAKFLRRGRNPFI